jgi:hypothetical protein
MKNIWMSALMFLFSRFMNSSAPTGSAEITRLKMTKMYIKSIESLRLLFITLFGMGVCLVFLLSAIVIFHAVIFMYMPWDVQTKISVSLFCAGLYFLIAIASFAYVFAQMKWLKMLHAEKILEQLNEQSRQSA